MAHSKVPERKRPKESVQSGAGSATGREPTWGGRPGVQVGNPIDPQEISRPGPSPAYPGRHGQRCDLTYQKLALRAEIKRKIR